MFITGSSLEGSDGLQVNGMYMSEDRKIWSNMPITKEQKLHYRQYKEDEKMYLSIIKHMRWKHNTNKEFNIHLKNEHALILEKKSTLSIKRQKWLIEYFKEE